MIYLRNISVSMCSRPPAVDGILLFIQPLVDERRNYSQSRKALREICDARRACNKIEEKDSVFWDPLGDQHLHGKRRRASCTHKLDQYTPLA